MDAIPPALAPNDDSSSTSTSLTGLILAGGRGSRLGGQDKGLVEWHGLPMIQHVIARLSPQVGRLLIVANRNSTTYEQWADVVGDVFTGFEGPLAGLHAGLMAMNTGIALVVPVDAPCLPRTLAKQLGWERAVMEHRLSAPVCAHDGLRPQPLFGLYRKTDAASMADALGRNERTLMRWHDKAGTTWVTIGDAGAFSNLNTPEDFGKIRPEPRESPP